MSKSTTIENLIEGLSTEDAEKVGTEGQIKLTKSETNKLDIYEYYNTVEEAEEISAEWLKEE